MKKFQAVLMDWQDPERKLKKPKASDAGKNIVKSIWLLNPD